MAYNPFKLAARLRRIATRLECKATMIVMFGVGSSMNADKTYIEKFLDEQTKEIFIRVGELRRIADEIKKPAPPIH